MPAWPLGTTYTKGLLGNRSAHRRSQHHSSRRRSSARRLDAGKSRRKAIAAIQSDPEPDGRSCARPAAPVRRQLRGVSRPRREGRQRLSEPDHDILAMGRHAGSHRRNHPGRNQFDPSKDAACRRCPPSGATRCCRAADVGNVVDLRPVTLRSGASREVPTGKAVEAGKQSLPPIASPVTAMTPRATRSRRAQPDRQVLDLWRRSRPSTHRSGAAGRATCRHGKADCRRSIARFSRFICRSRGHPQ